jgi:SAM-dependent methyltransferase
MNRVDAPAFTEFERSGWNRVADGYHSFLGPVTARAVEPLLDLAAVGPGVRVLDVATGPGYLAGAAAARGAEVVGVDLSTKILELARSIYPGVRFRPADAARLPFGPAEFDVVAAGFLLPHLADHDRVVAELCRVLATGGRVALSTWDRPDRVPLLSLIASAVDAAGVEPPPDLPAGPPFFAYSDQTALAGLLERAGMTDVLLASHSFTHWVRSADALWDGILSGSVRTAALVAGQPLEVRVAVRAAFDRLVRPFSGADGSLELPVSVLLAVGRG